ncbi:cytochrome P450 [Streptomyces hebeiensis]|uniref:Cytochrome P450 n=1 Tax=Streptomyces hebeiensis TaxID=229486 RepID=A0ABP4FN99_9ACTN
MDHTPPVALDPFGADIPAETERLRALGPVVPVTLPGGIPAHAITSYDLLRRLILDHRVSKDPRQHWTLWPQAISRPEWAWILSWVGVRNMLNSYASDHTRLRKLVAPSFTAKRTEQIRPLIEATTTRLLDALAATPAGEVVDLRAGLAYPLPMEVICELVGISGALRDDFADLVARIMDTTLSDEEALKTHTQINTLLAAVIEHKRAHPGKDLTTELIAVRDTDGDRLSTEELTHTLLLTYGAGFETTVHLITNTIYALLTHPKQLQRLRNGDITWDQTITETLRWAPSIANLPLRYAAEDIVAGGVTIPAGSAILTTLAAANRDPERFGPTAHTFRPGRDNAADHLAFGIGVHRCPGAPLAQLEAGHALPALFDRFPHMRLAPHRLHHVPSFIAHGWATIPVTLT